jgi:peptide/nickel transport system substrate-binding protein
MRTARIAAIALIGGALAWVGTGNGRVAAQDLVVGLGANVTSIDPHFHNLSPNSNIAQHVFNTLIQQDDKQRLIPGLATEWKAIDDKTWEFKLRQGVKFHDGSPFDAEDVLATLKRVPWVPNSPSSFALYTKAVQQAIVVDPHTIRFKTAAPYPLLPVDLSSVYIINRKMVEAPTVDFNAGKAAIGTGPFRFVEYKPGDRITLQRNDTYWGQKPHWANVTLRLMTNNATRVSALLSGDVQFIEQVPTADAKSLASNQNITLSRVVGNRVIYLHLDSFRDQTPQITDKSGQPLDKNPLKDVRVRKALNKAVNRQAIVERLMEGEAIPAGGLLAEGFFGVSPKLKPEPFDQEGARKLLAEAGYPNGFTMTIHGPNDRYVNDEKVLQAVGAM